MPIQEKINKQLISGGYDDGYSKCVGFWGKKPAQLVKEVVKHYQQPSEVKVLDLGCGEGKNSMYLAKSGFNVTAVDVSSKALRNAKALWGKDSKKINWVQADMGAFLSNCEKYNIIISTGPLHCSPNKKSISQVIFEMQNKTNNNGFNVISVFNARSQDLSGHSKSFVPCCLEHCFYSDFYNKWDLLHCSDKDLEDNHPHLQIKHHHSITRLFAKKCNKIG